MIEVLVEYILEKTKEKYGEDFVTLSNDGYSIYVDYEDSGCGCEIKIDYLT